MWAKPVCTNRKSASAERCLRALGATLAMGIPVMRRSQRSSQGLFSHQCLRKAMAADPVRTGLAGSAGIDAKDITFEDVLGDLCTHIHSSPPCNERMCHQ